MVKQVEKQIKETIKMYSMLDRQDRIAVALSGGKDSTTCLYILHKFGYNVEGLMIDLGLGAWSQQARENMQEFCSKLNIKFHVIDMKKEFGASMAFIKSASQTGLSGCYICGIIKKWLLNKKSKELGFDKLVTGHNLDDECQTVLMNFLKGNIYLGANSTPVTGKPIKGFVQRVKPLFFIPENKIRTYSLKEQLPIQREKCPCSFYSYRINTREWLNQIGDNDKLKIVKNFQNVIPRLEQKGDVNYCKKCGEPCRQEICKACQILQHI
ncbi:MAG: TIGR00269 family protein [Candidatus Nanoarchaeia archaeon]